MKKLILPILMLTMIGFAGAVDVGDEAPAFTLTALDGSTVSLGDYQGKIVYIFWFGYN
ncbi:MAG: redoxin domain-containing protein [Caldithrix sp.]|nr:redoxin domain-containing protein [Caldithrix sp.]